MVNGNPKVSVCVVTYNQEKYIRECLQSIVDQITDFDFEVIVADDCSTDGTRAIVQEFADRYPMVKAIFHEKNIGPYKNFIFVHQQAKGEYVAHIDGDDTMFPDKLMKQAAFLDEHPECSTVVHRMNIFSGSDKEILGVVPVGSLPKIVDINYLVENLQFFAHSSKMYRRAANIFSLRDDVCVDFYVCIEHASVGKIGFIDQVLGGYRKCFGSISDVNLTESKNVYRRIIGAFARARELGVPDQVVDSGIGKFKAGYAVLYLKKRDWENFRKLIIESAETTAGFTGGRHRLLFHLRNFPRLAFLLVRTYEAIGL